ncbi:MAG TPA: biotin synthase BioB [Polyangiales bacterium]|nr:biotin synthase BioB [Polyangiales bacterium]
MTTDNMPGRHRFTLAEVRAIHDLPLTQLLFRAQSVHRQHHTPDAVQLCTLLSIKTGGCPEDCGYCGQSARHERKLPAEPLMSEDDVLAAAARARAAGATRFCMGAAWRSAKGGEQFERVLRMVKGVRELGMEACVTLGMLNAEQARALKAAGLTAYNHNLDTSREYYPSIISTRTYDDRLETLKHVRDAGIHVCCGGIIGMGESVDDRCAMLVQLSELETPPESVPINALGPVPGTPLGERPPIDPFEMVRMCATARIVIPTARVRLSAGRIGLSREAQLLCFMAGANSIFFGDKLLTIHNPEADADMQLLADAGLSALPAQHEASQEPKPLPVRQPAKKPAHTSLPLAK